MKELLSDSAKKRLPTAIKTLPEKEQVTFVYLRMRRDVVYIAGQLGVGLQEGRDLIRNVQEALAKSGTLDLVRDPLFYPLDAPTDDSDDSSPPFQLADHSSDPADQLEIDRFFNTLRRSLDEMDQDGRRLLKLWFNKEMAAKDILSFYKNTGIPLKRDKPLDDCTTQDVFYQIEKNIQNLLSLVRTHMQDEENVLTPKSLRAILDETGAEFGEREA